MALAGTLGVGNIVGVASALYMGGPGAIFWMLVSGLVVSVLKYAEILLAVRHRRTTPQGQLSGGAHYYIYDSLSRRGHAGAGRVIACLFSLLCLLNAWTMGSVLQVNAAAGAMQNLLRPGVGLPALVTGGALAVLCAAVMTGGSRRIAAMTERLVPLMTLCYVGLCVAVLVLRWERLPAAVGEVLQDAFSGARCAQEGGCSWRTVGAGCLGTLTSRALRSGVMRGLVSNEAGCGTAPMAHAAARAARPVTQGLLGVIEVFVDTVLLCTITALALLVSDSGMAPFGVDGVANARAAFTSVLGEWSGVVFGLSILLFATATIFCWAHYGLTAVAGLVDTLQRPAWRVRAEKGFTCVFCLTLVLGATAAPGVAWDMADVAIGSMTILNLLFLLAERKEIVSQTRAFLDTSGSTVQK